MGAGRIPRRYGLLRWLIFVAVYFLLATISLETRDPWSLSSTIWLPAGLLLGVLCTRSPAQWPMWAISGGTAFFGQPAARSPLGYCAGVRLARFSDHLPAGVNLEWAATLFKRLVASWRNIAFAGRRLPCQRRRWPVQ